MTLSDGRAGINVMGGFPNLPFSNSFPISQAFPTLPVKQQWPSSSDAMMSDTAGRRKHPGSSSEVQINYPVQLRLWPDGQHNNILDGDLLMSINTDLIPAHSITMTLLNLTDTNLYLRKRYEEAVHLFESWKHSENDDVRKLAEVLQHTPTQQWPHFAPVAQGLRDARDRGTFLNLCFLTDFCINTFFNFYGFARGEIPDMSVKGIAAARGNVVDSIKNYWGNEAVPGMKLFLIRKRVLLESGFDYFAFVPFTGPCNPTYADTSYSDFSGYVQSGESIYVGKVVRWVENLDYTQDILDVMLGFKKPEVRTINRTGGTIRIKMHTLPGLKTNFVL